MKKSFKFVIAAIIAITGISCTSKNGATDPVTTDTTNPVLSLIDPTSNKTVNLGAALHLQMDLSDNTELRSYKVTITKSLKGVTTSDWSFNQTWQIGAGKKTFSVNHSEIVVPSTVTGNQTTTGNYDLTITCYDSSGNENSTTITIVLSKP